MDPPQRNRQEEIPEIDDRPSRFFPAFLISLFAPFGPSDKRDSENRIGSRRPTQLADSRVLEFRLHL